LGTRVISGKWEIQDPVVPALKFITTLEIYRHRKRLSRSVKGINGQNDRYRELWNLVFIHTTGKGWFTQTSSQQHVDTGMGFERIVRLFKGYIQLRYRSFSTVIAEIEKISGRE
jgi:alanyl-tRNA synthetase